MPTYDIEGVGSFDSESDLNEDQLRRLIAENKPAQASVGDLRQREGTGQIAAKKQAEVSDKNGQFLGQRWDLPESRQTPEQALRDEKLLTRQGPAFVASLMAPPLVAARLGIGVAATGVGWLAKARAMAASGAVAGAAGSTTSRVIEELQGEHKTAGETAKEIGIDTALGGGFGASLSTLGSVAGKVLSPLRATRLFSAGEELLKSGPDRLRRVGASLMRKPEMTAPQADLDTARKAIEATTGQRVDVTIGEAIGDPAIAHSLGREDAAVSSDAFDAIKRSITMTAARLRNSGATAEDLAKSTIASLEAEGVRVAAPAKLAVKQAADELNPAINAAIVDVEDAAKRLIPGTHATGQGAGHKIESSVTSALAEAKDAENAAWAVAKKNPEYDAVNGAIQHVDDWAQSVENSVPLSQSGTAIPGTMPKGINSLYDTVREMAPIQTLDRLRHFKSRVGESIGNDTVFPGASERQKQMLYASLVKDEEAMVAAAPSGSTLKAELQDAINKTKDKYERFGHRNIESIIEDFRGQGGATSESIANRITGTGGMQVINDIKTAAGPAHAAEIDEAVRGFLFHNAAEAGVDRVANRFSVQHMMANVGSLSDEMRTAYFPKFDQVVKLAQREAKIAGLKSAAPGMLSRAESGMVDSMSTEDAHLLYDALAGTPRATKAMDQLGVAFRDAAKLQSELNGSVVQAVRSGNSELLEKSVAANPEGFIGQLLDGRFGADQTQKAMQMLQVSNPAAFQDLQFRYVDHLLRSFTRPTPTATGRIMTKGISEELSFGNNFKAEGRLRRLSEAVLGMGRMSDLEQAIQHLSTFERAGGVLTPQSPLIDLAAKGAGFATASVAGVGGSRVGPIGAANMASNFMKRYDGMRYYFASHLLTTPELRELARTPISRITQERMQTVLRGFQNAMIGTYVGHDSPEANALNRLVDHQQSP